MNRHSSLGEYLREACRRKGVSLSQASIDLGHSRNWLETIVNGRVKRPRPENCQAIADYFGEDSNYIMQLAGYLSPPPNQAPLADEIIAILPLLSYDAHRMLLEHAQLLKFRATSQSDQVTFPKIPGINWSELDPIFARELAAFILKKPATTSTWVEALANLPQRAVELLLMNAWNQVRLKNEHDREQAARILACLAQHI